MLVEELARHIFEGRRAVFYAEFVGWLESSRRFRTFVEEHRNKIRKKVRIAHDRETQLDLRCELETAYRLLAEKRFTLEYEKYGQGGQRSPDLTATYRTHTLLNVEVTRPRITGDAADKLGESLCDKVGQMVNNSLNMLVIHAPDADGDSLVAAATALRLLAERKEEEFFVRRRFKDAREFIRQYQNLSAVGLKAADVFLWENPLAKKPLPDDLRRTLQRVL